MGGEEGRGVGVGAMKLVALQRQVGGSRSRPEIEREVFWGGFERREKKSSKIKQKQKEKKKKKKRR